MTEPSNQIPPEWIQHEVCDWMRRLGVEDYIVKGCMEALTDTDEERVYGQTVTQARYLRATITLSRTLEEGDYARHIIAHEVCHVLFGEFAAVADHLIQELPVKAQSLALDMWHDACDRTIERLVRAYRREVESGTD